MIDNNQPPLKPTSNQTITVRHDPNSIVTSARVTRHIKKLIEQYDKDGTITICEAINSMYTALEQAKKLKLPTTIQINDKLGLSVTLNCITLNVQTTKQVLRSRRYGHEPYEPKPQNPYLNFTMGECDGPVISRNEAEDYY